MAELNRAFEEYLDRYGPEFVVVGSGIIPEEILGPPLLHGREDGPGHLGEIGELLFKMFVLFRLGHEIDIGEGMGHLVEADIAVGRFAGDAADEVIPGKIDTGLIYMAHEGAGVETIMIVIAQDEDIVEVVELEFLQTKRQLNGSSADQNGHFGRLLYLYIMEILRMLKLEGAEQEFALFFETEPVIVSEMA